MIRRIIAVGDGGDKKSSHAGNREDVFDHERAGEQGSDQRPHHGQNRNQRIGKRVLGDHRGLFKSLGARRTHEVFAEGFHQGRAQKRGEISRRRSA